MINTYQDNLNDVIINNQNLIHSLAKQYDRRLHDDLFQVGVIGMIDAYSHYDSSMNTKFTTYAYSYVAGEMKKFVREDRSIKISRDIIYLCSKIEHTRELMRQKLHREPTLNELSDFLEISPDKITDALQANCYVKSIDEPITGEGKELTIKDVVGVKENYELLDLLNLRDELSKLSLRDKQIIEKRFLEERTQCETATMMGMSQVEVSRTEKKLILRLRNKLQ
ncbi:MAG: sigma-70 family RNA polymerase sigma factor [Bacilli bacterium]|nr:sigma-70 family RNA polymerase sigma factor [Bacilli bacterium]MDD3305034.1 sigma-70 family RNA polymerase sigma factor [Bacilli bacterium]MDD4053635.1 sigma-70 family RNA polymerase sigma factor [Bacilli bacterium]MDD4411134.1 sigma-70 family RNA polymerase sigma factor [Bacilli bacterium]